MTTAQWVVITVLAFVAGIFVGRWPIRNLRTWPRFRRRGHTWVQLPDELDQEYQRLQTERTRLIVEGVNHELLTEPIKPIKPDELDEGKKHP